MMRLGPRLQQRLAAMEAERAPAPAGVDQVTFAITAFERPRCVELLVDSIRRFYPGARILIADNGRTPAAVDGVEYLTLPYDCGISTARNLLAQQTRTPYMLLLEDDFVFTESTRIEDLIDVLESDPEVGAAGGGCRLFGKYFAAEDGEVSTYASDMEVFRDTLRSFPPRAPVQITPAGTPYQPCDMIWNFCLLRREFLADHVWDDRLRTAEHYEYFLRVKKAAKWRVAYCPSVIINHEHVPERDTPLYKERRRDTARYLRIAQESHGIEKVELLRAAELLQRPIGLANVLILTVGRSGSSVLARMMHQLGWHGGDADGEYAESVEFREINQAAIEGTFDRARAERFLEALPQPWLLKDPRFLQAAPFWFDLIGEYQPRLLWLTRDPERVLESHQAKGWTPRLGSVEAGLEHCQRIYDRWPWGRHHVAYERLRDAVGLFDPSRGNGRSGWLSKLLNGR